MILAIIQARMGSSRLPGKVMLDICGQPVLWHVIQRVKSSKYIDQIIIATGEGKDNDLIREFCLKNNISCYSGSENDVLDRFYQAAQSFNAENSDVIIRITADCPLIDSEIIDKVIEFHNQKDSDYTSNVINPTFPDGLDCEVFKFSVLKKAWEEGNLKSEREHVTPYIRNHPKLFKLENYEGDKDLSDLRWTLDEEEDFQLIKKIYEELYDDSKIFSMMDILDLLDRDPDISKINSKYIRNEGLIKSLKEDGFAEDTKKELREND